MYSYVIFFISDQNYRKEVENFPRIAHRVMPDEFSVDPEMHVIGENMIMFVWLSRAANPEFRNKINSGLLKHPDKGRYFSTNYADENMLAGEQHIFDLVDSDNPVNFLKDSPGGVSANIWIPRGEAVAHCWSTQPPALPTFYAKNRKGLCVVGSRPRLVHAASTLNHGHRLDRAYGEKYLVSGFAVDGQTPFHGVKAVPPNKSLKIENGEVIIRPYPLAAAPAIPQETPLSDKGKELAALLRAASWPAKAYPEARLFLSGGKDSRVLSCALTNIGAKVKAFTLGTTKIGDGPIAKEVAESAKFSFETRGQYIISDPLKAAAHSMMITDGLGINFAHQYNFKPQLRVVGI